MVIKGWLGKLGCKHKKKNRIKRIEMSLDFLSGLLKKGERHYKIIGNALPDDARIIRVTDAYRFERDTVWLVVESKEFKPLDEAELVPILDSPLFEELEPQKVKL